MGHNSHLGRLDRVAGGRNGHGHAGPQAIAFWRPVGGTNYCADHAGGQPSGGPLSGRFAAWRRSVLCGEKCDEIGCSAHLLDVGHRRCGLRGPAHQQRGSGAAVWSHSGNLYSVCIAADLVDCPHGDAATVFAGNSGASRHNLADHPAKVVLAVLALVIPIAFGIQRLEYESNYINAFKPKTRVVRDYHSTEAKLGGIGVVSLVVPIGSKLTMEVLAAQRDLENQIRDLNRGGESEVSQVLSLATVLDPEGKLAKLPQAQAEAALETKLDLISRAPQANLLKNFWSPLDPAKPETGWARLVIRIQEQIPAPAKAAVFQSAIQLAGSMPAFQVPGRAPYLTGLSYLLTQTTRGVMDSSWITFLSSAAGIIFMLTCAFRGPKLATLAILPTLLAVALVLGFTGWSGVKLDLATALVASVALGLSVDDTFHCLLQFRRHRETEPFRQSLLASYHVTGAGVLLSSLAVAAGFGVLRFGQFLPFSNFGTMVGVATLGSSIGNLILLPACLALGHRFSRAADETLPVLNTSLTTEAVPESASTPLEGV